MRLFTPNHVQLVQACYPPSSAIIAAGPDCRPNSQELSRLTYYASNRPGKLTKLGNELEKRAKLEAQRARYGNAKAKSSLLITLTIFKALVTECRRDVSLLTPPLIASIVASLSCFPHDLEVAARSASVFTAWTTYTDGQLIGVDTNVTSGYKTILRCFSDLSRIPAKKGDGEIRNRQRLVAIAALTGVVTSDALYHSSSEFSSQVSIIIPGLLLSLQEADLEDVKDEAASVRQQPSASSTYLSEFSPRPLSERRAASIHIHVDGERGPSFSDVVNACLRALQCLLERSNANQVSAVLQAAFEDAEAHRLWENTPLCCWFAQTVADWTQYQYRYAVPKKLVDKLVHVQDAPTPTSMHYSLASMISTVFTSPTPLVNVSTSDTISYLLALLVRRTSINSEDELLPHLVNCTAALGAHVYYQDQIHDLAEELISRLVSVQVNGLLGRGRGGNEPGREQGMRCLLAALSRLLSMADRIERPAVSPTSPTSIGRSTSGQSPVSPQEKALSIPGADDSARIDMQNRSSRRTRVPPEAWQDTLALLCEADYGVRTDYARALCRFIRFEVHKEPFAIYIGLSMDKSGDTSVDRVAPIVSARRTTPGISTPDPTWRFLNALHASVFTLATSSTLGLLASPSGSTRSSSQQLIVPPTLNVISATPTSTHGTNEKSEALSAEPPKEPPSPPLIEPSQSQQSSRPRPSISLNASRTRRSSVLLSLPGPESSTGGSPAATPCDYAHLVDILNSVHECLPGRALLTGVPMLLALDTAAMQDVENDEYSKVKRRVMREMLARVLENIGRIWECKEVIDIAEKALAALGYPPALPTLPPARADFVHASEVPVDWSAVPIVAEAETSALSQPFIDQEQVVQALAANSNARTVTGLERQALLRRLALEWTLESALKDSVERQSSPDILRGDGLSPFLKISPALMHIENLSLQSLARTQHGVGVQDLREALEGRGSMPNLVPSTRPSSIRTLDQPSMTISERPGLTRSRTGRTIRTSTKDVRDVLNKLGVGKQNGNSLLKASFPAFHRPDGSKSKPSGLLPPYPT